MIVAHALTEPTVDAATMGIDLMETVDDEIARVTADAAYETVAFYAAAEMRDATVVVPPSKTARVSRRRPRSRARDRTITDVRTLGRRRWKQEAGYPLQARVENAFFRYKSILGDRLRARSRGGRVAESVVACNVLNQMTELGRPESYSKPVFVQAFVAEAPVEGLDVGVLVRLAGFNETQGQPLRVRPCEHRAPAELLPSPGRRRPPGWAPRSGAWPGGPGRAGAGLSLAASATGIVKVKRAPRPTPPLSARMRPPWASTRPLQMASPSPLPRPPARSPAVVYLRNSWPSWSGAMSRPSSATETATSSPSRSAAIRLRQICAAREVTIIRGAVSPDHVHMLVVAPPQLSPSKLVQFLKRRSSRMLQREFPALRKRYWGQHLWARGYYCASVGAVDEKTIREYIEHQRCDEDVDGFKVTAPTAP